MHPQNARLRRVQDGRGHERAVNTPVGDRERPALHFRHAQLAVTRLRTLFGNRLFDGGKGHGVGVVDHRHHKTRGRACGDAHVDVVLVNDVGAVNLCVDLGHFVQGVHAGLCKEGHEAQFHAVLLEEQVFVFVAQGHHLGHVDLVVGGQHGGGVLAVLEALGDGLAQTGHFDPFFAGGLIGGHRRARGGGCGGRFCAAFKGLQHVLFHDATILAGPRDIAR